MPVVGYRLESPKDISQEEFDRGILRVKEGFKRKDVDFESTIMSGYEKRVSPVEIVDVMEFIKVV